ncbi:Dynein heavy chain, cytoplasmic [Dirofilaria immitis]|nr:Dynein heavy chain, cytoplasmic [Dirofilaria immitis]
MAALPQPVRLTLESICLLLGENVGMDWKAIRGVMVKDDFMPRILNFDTDSISAETLKMMEKYIRNPDWDFDKVNRASSACGPMIKWMKAQLWPLRTELERLEKDAKIKTAKGEDLKKTIAKLEQSIAAYKEEYAQLIGQAEAIKADLATVKEKVGRSTKLLGNLGSERDRWNGSCDGFSQQMDSLIGDALLSAAFLAYSGYYDQQLRDLLFHRWTAFVEQAEIKHRSDLARVEYLSSVDERLEWSKTAYRSMISVPRMQLCFIADIFRFNRYPLIIDPSGQAINYLMKQFVGKSITKTSFLDDSFRKNLESALRFGNSLLVQDVESYDPILNPVLNREVKRTGGRILIRLGDQDIDLSPSFQIFLITRDASVEFPPDLCSRVTFVNFTVTRASLEMQCLNQVLEANDQMEFAVRLRQLEKALLAALNESKGKILDDDSVISTLEKLKNEAAEVGRKSAETDKIMAEVEAVSQHYSRLAQACSLIYLMLQQLNEVHFLYQYSLDFLLEIFMAVLVTPELESVTDYDQRLKIIMSNLFQMVYRRVSLGMLHQDKILLALLLMRIVLKGNTNERSYQLELDHLLGRSEIFAGQKQVEGVGSLHGLNAQQLASLFQLSRLPAFTDIVKKVTSNLDLGNWVVLDNPELNVPIIWNGDDKLTRIGRRINELLVIHALRPDRLLACSHRVVGAAFGDEFMQKTNANRPILLSSATGFDASGKVEDLAVEMGREVTSIAIGSAEGFSQADAVLNSASKSGRWILLKNVHLAPSWLAQLEKRLHSLKPHPQFRLLLTAEIHPKLPPQVLRASRIIVYEPATGLKANLLRSLSSLSPQRITKLPVERSRLYFLICWLHAIVQERMRYIPLGWANSYEFSDADLRVACDTLDASVDSIAMGRANVSPEKLPWHTLRCLLSQCIYGGKIDNEFDQMLLDCFLGKLFTAKSFDADRILIGNIDGKGTDLCIPDGNSREHLIHWVEKCSIYSCRIGSVYRITPKSIAYRTSLLDEYLGETMLSNLLKVSDEELAFTGDDQKTQAPPWMSVLAEQTFQWLKLLPKNVPKLKRSVENIKDPLFRFFEREINHGAHLLASVRNDLIEVHSVCRGERKQSNHTRALTLALNKGLVPTDWLRYTVPKIITVMAWIHDFTERVQQLIRLAGSASLKKESIWLGGLFAPEAYITATRQTVAQSNQWSLEELRMHIEVGVMNDRPDTFRVEGLRLMGAICKKKINWKLWTNEPLNTITLPVYLYRDRKNLLFTLDFDPGDVQKQASTKEALLSHRTVHCRSYLMILLLKSNENERALNEQKQCIGLQNNVLHCLRCLPAVP